MDLVVAALYNQERINKTKMSNNTFQRGFNPMSTSSMLTTNTNNEFKRTAPFTNNLPSYDPFARIPNGNYQQSGSDLYPRALASQSMISTNTSSSRKGATFGKLDSMARKVTTTFKQQNAHQPNNKPENPFAPEDNISQSMIQPSPMTNKPLYGFGKFQQTKKMFTEPTEPTIKKRRESIDLGRTEVNSEMLPFMRRNDPKLPHSQQDINSNGLQAMKQKNFEFLRKRKEATGSETTASMIVPSMNGVQSMKNLQQFSLNNNFKKPEFLSPISKPPMNEVKCPQDIKPKNEFNSSSFNSPLSPTSPNFQFKKKKAFEVPIQISAAKQVKDQPSKEPMTLKERRNAKSMREIKLNDFELLQKLGKGAFGDVYMAQQKTIGFICVIKKMSKKRIRETKVQNHVLRQIKIQSYLSHPNLTSLFGYFHDEENLYLIIQALPDGSLQQVKKKRKLPEKETAAIVKQVSEGLKYMHEESIIHRDLKPQNLFCNQNVIKIGDFGCSIFNQNSGLRTTVVGCLEYSSPQQLSNEGYSQKIDAWSLGILTYELLFGKSPFEKDIINITRNKEAEAKLSELVFPTSIAVKEETKMFIENLLEENPDKRMDMDEVLCHDFLKEEMAKKLPKLELI